jgi:hypothetical protein
MNATWKAVLGITLIFVFGCICGAIVMTLSLGHRAVKIAQAGPPLWAKLIEPRLTHGMDLNDDQKKQIYDALVKNLQARVALRKELAPRVQVLNQQTLTEVDAVLKPDDQQLFLQNYSQFKVRSGRLFNTGMDTSDDAGTISQSAPVAPPHPAAQ